MFYHRLLLTISLVLTSITAGVAQAQIESDGSVDTKVNSHQNLIEITGGQQRGDNLFHSFENFSVPKHIEAFFNNNPGIANIFSRVTGGNLSIIEGLIRANDANLILINPNGIIFSEGAQLQLGNGSFIGTTADSIVFKDGTEFSATDSGPPILTISTPIGLRWSNNPAGIQSQDANLEVEAGETIGLIGGNLILERTTITAPGGQVELGGVGTSGEITLNEDFSISNIEVNPSNIEIIDSIIDVSASGGGWINIHSGDLEIINSDIIAGISYEANAPEAVAGDIIIKATGDVTVDWGLIANIVQGTSEDGNVLQGRGNSGNIEISANSLEVINGGQITTSTLGIGDGGRVIIQVESGVKFEGFNDLPETESDRLERFDGLNRNQGLVFSGAFSNVQVIPDETNNIVSVAEGSTGNIEIIADSIEVTNGARLAANNFGIGNAGSVVIEADAQVSINGGSVNSTVGGSAVGNASGIEITADSVEVTNGARLAASSFGQGNAGSLVIEADGKVSINGGSFNSIIGGNAEGNAGNVEIKADVIEIFNGGEINTTTSGKEDGGNVLIQGRELVRLDGQNPDKNVFINSRVQENAEGNAGNVKIKANRVEILNGANIDANTRGNGNGGDVLIEGTELVKIDGFRIDNQNRVINTNLGMGVLEAEIQGNAGNLEIRGNVIEITNGANINANTLGKGDGGDVLIQGTELVRLDGFNTAVSSSVSKQGEIFGEGDAGNVEIRANSIEITNGAQVRVNTNGIGNAGNVLIEATELVSLDGENKNTPTFVRSLVNGEGDSGTIKIKADLVEITNGAQVDASTQGNGDGGDVLIEGTELVRLDGLRATNKGPSRINIEVGQNAEGDAGSLEIRGNVIEVTNGAQINANTRSKGDGGDVLIEGTELVRLDGFLVNNQNEVIGTNLNTVVLPGGIGNAGRLEIRGNVIEITNGAQINANTRSKGDGGDVLIEGTELVRLDGFLVNKKGIEQSTAVSSSVGQSGEGDAGSLEIRANRIEITNGAQVRADTSGIGNAGNIFIQGRELVRLDGQNPDINVFILSRVLENAEGNAGGVEIKAETVEILNGALILANTRGKGDGGDVLIEGTELVRLDGFRITSNGERVNTNINTRVVTQDAEGDAGSLEIRGNVIEITNGSTINANTLGKGDGGDVLIQGTELVRLDGFNTAVSSSVSKQGEIFGEGDAGNVEIRANSIEITNGAQVRVNTNGIGNAGNVLIEATELVSLDGGSVSSQVQSGGVGNAGGVAINADTVEITNNAEVSTSTAGVGNAGNIEIETNDLTIAQGASITAETFSESDGGSITIDTSDLQLTDSATITSNVEGTGKAGDININASFVNLSENSTITSSVSEAASAGGNITIDANSVIAFTNSDILAFSSNGLGGSITINSPAFFGEGYFGQSQGTEDDRVDVNAQGKLSGGNVSIPDVTFIQNSLVEFSTTVIEVDQLIAGTCLAPSPKKPGRFVLSGNGGFPYTPGDIPTSDYPTARVRTTEPDSTSVNVDNIQELIEPSGFYTLENGQIILGRRCRF